MFSTGPLTANWLIPGLKNEVLNAYLMANLEKLESSSDESGVTVQLPAQALGSD